ncbi:MAG: signal recognition particle-docking protein FtsY [Candidatus Sumerlaeia bacterium]|nr:signal recognition particle-docking protein FtsY [Candidatus Sumerlaeia bacterium]
MSEEPREAQEQPTERELRPGFFSRVVEWKKEQGAPAAADPAPSPAEPAPEAKRGLLRGLFGGGKKVGAEPMPEEPGGGWFARLTERLGKASSSLTGRLRSVLGIGAKLDSETLDTIEEVLIQSDVSMETTGKIVSRLRERARRERIEGRDAVMAAVKDEIARVFLRRGRSVDPRGVAPPYVVMVVGVNGVGKTTTIGKMAKRFADEGLKVALVAGDTFRAAAVEQLDVWAARSGAEIVKAPHGADAGSLVFDALQRPSVRACDVVLIDTAGRLHTKSNLMAELEKVSRVIKKQIPAAPHETLIVIDATTGQNAVNQVAEFSKSVPITGIVMTKLDGTAKGGVLVTLRDRFDIPVTLVGVGEGIDDLRDFEPLAFVEALFAAAAR